MWYVCDVLYAVLYIGVCCFVVCGCAVSRRYIDVCYCDVFSVVNVYLDHLKFCVLMVEGMSVVVNVMLSLMSVMSPPPALCNIELGFLNCDDICMCAVNKQFELLELHQTDTACSWLVCHSATVRGNTVQIVST